MNDESNELNERCVVCHGAKARTRRVQVRWASGLRYSAAIRLCDSCRDLLPGLLDEGKLDLASCQ